MGDEVRVLRGDPPADAESKLSALVKSYGQLIRAIVARVSGRRASSPEEIEQRVIQSLWDQVRRERTIEQPASYIYRCAVRETVRAIRAEQAHRMEELEDGENVRAQTADPERALGAKETVKAVERCLLALDPERQKAVRAHLSGFDVAEVMRMNCWPYQKARNLIARGIADLRALLDAEGIRDV